MSEQLTLEQRLCAVEKEIAELKQQLSKLGDKKSWIEEISGTFKDDPDFNEIVRLGKEFRDSIP